MNCNPLYLSGRPPILVYLLLFSHLNVTTETEGGDELCVSNVGPVLLLPPFMMLFDAFLFTAEHCSIKYSIKYRIYDYRLEWYSLGWKVFTILNDSMYFFSCCSTSALVRPSTMKTSAISSFSSWQEYPILIAVSERDNNK